MTDWPDTDASTATAPGWQVYCLCAAWCGVCSEWRSEFERLATAHPELRFTWVDIEDQAEALGEVDVETFPTLLVAQGRTARFFGPVPPQPSAVTRLLTGLRAQPEGHGAGAEAHALLQRLQQAA